MAVTKQDMDLTSGLTVVRDTDANATSEDNINGGAGTLHLLKADNTANSAAASYVKLYNSTGPTVGTTAPDFIIMVPAASTVQMSITEGVAFGTGISAACVTAGGTGGTTNPTSDVALTLVIA